MTLLVESDPGFFSSVVAKLLELGLAGVVIIGLSFFSYKQWVRAEKLRDDAAADAKAREATSKAEVTEEAKADTAKAEALRVLADEMKALVQESSRCPFKSDPRLIERMIRAVETAEGFHAKRADNAA